MSEEQKLGFDDFAEITQLKQKIASLQTKRAAMQTELSERLTANMDAQRVDPIADGARALVDGGNPAEAVADRKELTATSQKIQIFERAEAMVRGELQRTQAKASKEICASLRPEFLAAWKGFATLATALSEKGAEIRQKYDNLQAEGILYSGHLPMPFPLGPYDGRDPGSRLNVAINKVCEDWSLKVERKTLAEAEQERHSRHMAEAKVVAAAKRRSEKADAARRERARGAHKGFMKKLGLPA